MLASAIFLFFAAFAFTLALGVPWAIFKIIQAWRTIKHPN